MKTKIEKWKFVKQIETGVEVELPDEIEYHFQTGIRRSIAIIPEWTSWQKDRGKEEEIWKYDFICVYDDFKCKIEKASIQVSQISSLLQNDKDSYSLVDFLVNEKGEYTVRSKERFMADYNKVLNNINELL